MIFGYFSKNCLRQKPLTTSTWVLIGCDEHSHCMAVTFNLPFKGKGKITSLIFFYYNWKYNKTKYTSICIWMNEFLTKKSKKGTPPTIIFPHCLAFEVIQWLQKQNKRTAGNSMINQPTTTWQHYLVRRQLTQSVERMSARETTVMADISHSSTQRKDTHSVLCPISVYMYSKQRFTLPPISIYSKEEYPLHPISV